MAETLGSLCDKLTILKLKQWHSEEPERLANLAEQECRLKDELDEYVADAINGVIPVSRLTFCANKVYKREGNEFAKISGGIGDLFARLAHINCELWHEQEKVYEFESVPAEQKDNVVKQLALLNLQRNECIDAIDANFKSLATAKSSDP